jgi:hypothetical protein
MYGKIKGLAGLRRNSNGLSRNLPKTNQRHCAEVPQPSVRLLADWDHRRYLAPGAGHCA